MLKERLLGVSVYIFGFFSFAGSYAGFLFSEKYINLPGGVFRLLILLSLFFIFFVSRKKRFKIIEVLFILFSFFYLERILFDYLRDVKYYTSLISVLMNFILGGLIPILVLGKIKFQKKQYTILIKSFICSGIIFGAAVLIYYGQYIGEVSRLSANTTGDDSIMNPLNLSYISAMTVSVGVMYYKDKLNFKTIIIITLIIASAIPAFFLGASRGAVLSLFFPFIFMWLSRPTIKKTFKLIFVGIVVILAGLELSETFESSLIERFSTISSGQSASSQKEDRVYIWKSSINNQFLSNPVFGDSIKTIGIERYPHNLFVEALQATGLLGGIPMIVLIFICLYKSFLIFRYYIEYSWIAAFFLLCFAQSMFSFSIYSNKWIWISVALLSSLNLGSIYKKTNKITS